MSLNTEETIYLNPNINTLFGAVKAKLDKYDKRLVTLVDIIENVVEVVELTKLKGSSKKDLALELIRCCIEYVPDTRIDLREIIKNNLDNGLISDTINLIIKASKQELKINSIVEIGRAHV